MLEKRKKSLKVRIKERWADFRRRILSLLLSPFVLFKRLCFWIGFLTLLVFFVLSLTVFLFYHSLPNLKTMEFKEVKQLAREKVYSRLEDKRKVYKWVTLKGINLSFVLEPAKNLFSDKIFRREYYRVVFVHQGHPNLLDLLVPLLSVRFLQFFLTTR